MRGTPLFGQRVYVKSPKPSCPKHGEWDMHQHKGGYRCTFGWTDIRAQTKCDYTTSERVRLLRVEANLDDFEEEKPWFGDVDKDSL